jgi:NAD(P)-dependent dehydrogenase (short-subunit alcohol dehydrogenase family)
MTLTLITGANQGLGQAAALRLAELGHHVIVTARTAEKAERVAKQITDRGHQASALELDLTDRGHHGRAAAWLAERHGRLDVLVNNAGAIFGEPWMGNSVLEVSPEVLKQTFDLNFFAQVELTRALVPLLRKGRSPRVVNLSSIMGSLTSHADPNGPLWGAKPFAYDASKAALNAFTVHLAQALAPDGILVNSAHPGWVKTALGGEYAPLTVEQGIETVVALATLPDGGPTATFVHRGEPVPW